MARTRPNPAAPYALGGLLSALAGAGVGHLVGALLDPRTSPVAAVGGAVIDATPTPVKNWAVTTFGTADKAVLLASVIAVTLAAAAGTGVVARRRRSLGLALLALLVALATLAAVLRPGTGVTSAVPGLATAAVGLAAARALWDRADRLGSRGSGEVPGGPGAAYASRRSFLGAAFGSAAVAAAGGAGGQALTGGGGPASAPVPLPRPVTALAPLPAGVERTVRGVAPLVTPSDAFYRIDTALVPPAVDAGGWRLTVDGDVERPYSLTYAELLALPMVEADITLCCVSNEVGGDLVSSARWLGVRTRDLLARAGVRPGADQVLSTSTDGMTISTPVQALTDDRDALVAVAMNGRPLPRLHGFPARLVTPGLYGFVGATKWLTRMTLTTYAAEQAYWTERGWAAQAPVLTQSRIDTPGPGEQVAAGRRAIGGVAWAQHRGIARVEVRVDDGPWQEATLGPDAGIDFWRQWYLPWDATSGRHTLTVRATDLTGATQPEQRTDPFPSGAQGWHSILVIVG